MTDAYLIADSGDTVPVKRIHCKNEGAELQALLEKNPNLLPGEQIQPENPRRWLLIRREMPVPDPGTTDNRWSIDHFLADQDGIPTLVECKRFLDSRSRREVIGQMLDYAANGPYYWDAESLRNYAANTAEKAGRSLDEALQVLRPEIDESTDNFFERVANNLREGQVRLAFFLEEAPSELKSVVDFLNRQMERSEVLIVEAKMFEHDGRRIVLPQLFGYTEQARRVKRTVTVSSAGRRKWTVESFFEDARGRMDNTSFEGVQRFHDQLVAAGLSLRTGSGKDRGSISYFVPALASGSILSLLSDGTIWLNFQFLAGTEQADRFGDELGRKIMDEVGLRLPKNFRNRFPSIKIQEWLPRREALVNAIAELIEQGQHGI